MYCSLQVVQFARHFLQPSRAHPLAKESQISIDQQQKRLLWIL